MKKIVFIVPQLSQPRCIKRIKTIVNSGVPIKVYGFDNGLYNHNIDNLTFPITERIPRLKEATRIQKISFFFKTIKRILTENKNNSIFYLFGYEMGSIAYLLGCRDFIYEEADVSAARIKNSIIRSIMLRLDRLIISHSKFTVFTSGGFVDYIYAKKRYPQNTLLLPNKLSLYFDSYNRKEFKKKKIDYSSIKCKHPIKYTL